MSNATQILQEGHAKRHWWEVQQQSAEVDYLTGPEINSNPYDTSVARTHPTHNLSPYYPDIKDEVQTAFEELLDVKDSGTADKLLPFAVDADASDSMEDRFSSRNCAGDRMKRQQQIPQAKARRSDHYKLSFKFAIDEKFEDRSTNVLRRAGIWR
ncbi:hypothetical protein EDD16DRAFT_1727291 [Pisolithus croceorrhizus]|nr:hypothetical protein EV401DRAFT_2080247 [Pisolithus croceorrhizus]KAI6116524.1 hypothetical protein EDD16DRAFT_1727291 [Pisolithus croceorrhizus]